MPQPFETSTSKWTLVVLGVSQTKVRVWVGTLFHYMMKPELARVELIAPDGKVIQRTIKKSDWKRPFRYVYQRFYSIVEFDNLTPGTHYQLRFSRRLEKIKGVPRQQQWQELRDGKFDTLPESLPDHKQAAFTIGLGSCFYSHRDGGQTAGAYRALYERGHPDVRPDITFLTGDQVYLDIGFDSLSLISKEIRDRVANDYAEHWQLLGSIFTRGGTWMLADDHEYWNDYPFYDSLLPTLLTLKLDYVRKAWTKAAQDGVRKIQCSPTVETFSIGTDISFCLADLRSGRDKKGFMSREDFRTMESWAKNLQSPGVLVLSQPLLVERSYSERNLVSFESQYKALLVALADSGHDIVVLSGDVHFGRISETTLTPSGRRLIEVVSSPLSNLTGLNGLATSGPKFSPHRFPDPREIVIHGWKPAKVKHNKKFAVSTKRGFIASAYPRERTREHFMTVGFQRHQEGGIKLSVNAWRVRERDQNNLPVRDFEPYETLIQ